MGRSFHSKVDMEKGRKCWLWEWGTKLTGIKADKSSTLEELMRILLASLTDRVLLPFAMWVSNCQSCASVLLQVQKWVPIRALFSTCLARLMCMFWMQILLQLFKHLSLHSVMYSAWYDT
ncbi:hypothetical protein KIL84_011898 [Mauremys mutica]|uniref:Uncharacterized protein n=1 Tax=Mauremys mutica TaxID=74926 RepID=A0A9D3XEK4_9SAUR|nr:hypothetical protein KIL84_011898 [Mauremys mutica]